MAVVIIFALDLFSFYLAFDILDSYFCIFLAGARLATIEEEINRRHGQTLMVWETQFQRHPFTQLGSSRVAITAYQIAFVGIGCFILPLVLYGLLLWKGSLKWPWLMTVPIVITVVLFLCFVICFLDVFKYRRIEAPRILREMLAGRITVPEEPATDVIGWIRGLLRRRSG